MYIFEITTPGTWLDYEDREWTWKIEGMLRHLQNQFFEANTALNLFEGSAGQRPSRKTTEQWRADAERRTEIRRQVEAELGFDASVYLWEKISHETEVRFKREEWSKGHIPRELAQNVIFIFARAFVYALDGFDKFLGVLAKEAGVPQRLAELSEKFALVFPDLRGVRNTTQHLEDRSRGLGAGRAPKPMTLQPVENGFIHAPNGGALVLNSLSGNRFGCTMADGHYGEVEISPHSVQALSDLLHEVLQCFKWKGGPQHAPSA
ncbi:hypothetical protein [Ralstonia wenshanensis]|uniref:hypothetical protein n=1 Tax=Ralstonia wenshanensis TaxID=2842456 RepID=UPI0021B32D4F|nr:hypothetical protein [Ralstonia wenshanensis]MCT7307964.1 hypothetical protein [Ralstonia wenshanensis]